MRAGIRLKLVTFISILLLAVVFIFSFIVLNGIKSYQNRENKAILFNQKNMFEQYLEDKFSTYYSVENKDIRLVSGEIFRKTWLSTIPASLYGVDGKLLSGISTQESPYSVDDEDKLLEYALDNKMTYKYSGDYLIFYSPLKYKNNTVSVLKLEYSIKSSNEFYLNIKRLFIIAGILVLLIGSITGSIYMLSFTNAIRKMKWSVQSIQDGNFKEVEQLPRSDELGDLSQGIKYMSDTIESNIIELEKERDYLKKAVDKLKEYDLQQREFINNVTHEFKTPLTSIKAYADVIALYDYDAKLVKDASFSISSECNRLKSMIETVLDLSKIEKYDFDFCKQSILLKPLFTQICLNMSGKIKKNGLSLEYAFEDLELVSDEDSLRYIFINLLDNAVKYNKSQGKISVNLSSSEESIYLSVSDTGIGIAEKDMSKIFEPFYRANDDRSRSSGGSGLGLAFTKKLVEKLNGTIDISSQAGTGSKFTVTLPKFAKT